MAEVERIGGGSAQGVSRKIERGDQQVDLKLYFFKILSYWPLYFVAFALAFSLAFLVNRYSNQIYKTSISLLINEEDVEAGGGLEGVMSALGYSDNKMHVENEILVLKSRYLMEKTLDNFNEYVSYFGEGKIRVNELYGRQPFIVD